MDNPRVFFSYSVSKTSEPDLVEDVVTRLKRKARDKKWKVEDPLSPDVRSVREKVEKSLWHSDAAIVEVTTNSPNVMVEVGFARALSYPCIFLVNKNVYGDPKLKEYFDFLKLGACPTLLSKIPLHGISGWVIGRTPYQMTWRHDDAGPHLPSI